LVPVRPGNLAARADEEVLDRQLRPREGDGGGEVHVEHDEDLADNVSGFLGRGLDGGEQAGRISVSWIVAGGMATFSPSWKGHFPKRCSPLRDSDRSTERIDTITRRNQSTGMGAGMAIEERATLEAVQFSAPHLEDLAALHRALRGIPDLTIRYWDFTNPARPVSFAPIDLADRVLGLAFAPLGRVLASGTRTPMLRFWDLSDPSRPIEIGQPFTDFRNSVGTLTFSPKGRLLASGTVLTDLRLWDVSDLTRPVLLSNPLSGDDINDLAAPTFRPDGKILASKTDTEVRLWNITDPSHPQQASPPAFPRTARRSLRPGSERDVSPGMPSAEELHPVASGSSPAQPIGAPNRTAGPRGPAVRR
jgi:hypothetical protein